MDEDSRSSSIRLARGGGYCRAPQWRLTTRYHGHIISNKAMKVRMLHCELKWEIPIKIVATSQQADEMAADGFDFRLRFVTARRCLDKGATAFCIFSRREIAHIGWVATSEEAKNTFDPPPYQVDFSNRQACTVVPLPSRNTRERG